MSSGQCVEDHPQGHCLDGDCDARLAVPGGPLRVHRWTKQSPIEQWYCRSANGLVVPPRPLQRGPHHRGPGRRGGGASNSPCSIAHCTVSGSIQLCSSDREALWNTTYCTATNPPRPLSKTLCILYNAYPTREAVSLTTLTHKEGTVTPNVVSGGRTDRNDNRWMACDPTNHQNVTQLQGFDRTCISCL